ncbi:MAG: S1C family serine protease [Actinomycetota bacterium]
MAAVIQAAALTGCNAEVKKAEQRPIVQMEAKTSTDPIRFEKLVFDVKRGAMIGGYVFNPFLCRANPADISWGAGRVNASSIETADIFYNEMVSAGYQVLGDPKKLFAERSETRATYGVAGRVTEVQFALCDEVHPLFGYRVGLSGDAYVKIQWQVLDKHSRRVVFDTFTEGSFKNTTATVDGDIVALNGALANAVANLAADTGFFDLVSGKGSTEAAAVPRDEQPLIRVRVPSKLSAAPINQHMDKVRASAVTILSDGGHGSGFFFSRDGYVLTNQHVVGDAKMVTVRLPSGREMMGEVIRRHKLRDVALILVEEQGYPALPMRRGEPVRIGDEVFAIGAPLEVKLSGTVTKGIVSAIRRDERDGQEMIQGDVSIHPGNSGGPLLDDKGNVIGIAVAGYTGGFGNGLNLFIPIDDALSKLRVQLVDERAPR